MPFIIWQRTPTRYVPIAKHEQRDSAEAFARMCLRRHKHSTHVTFRDDDQTNFGGRASNCGRDEYIVSAHDMSAC